jgi:hypothetical protein
MDKKKYLKPLTEIEEVEMIAFMQSMSAFDPAIIDDWGEDPGDIPVPKEE